jgi:hypothetical protein
MTFDNHPINIFTDSFREISDIIDGFGEELTSRKRKKLAEASRYLFQFYNSTVMADNDGMIVHQWIDRINDVLARDLYNATTELWRSFRYFHKNFSGNPQGQMDVTESFVLSILALEASGSHIDWTASVIKDLPEYHIGEYLQGLDSLIKDSEHQVRLLFLLLNTVEMLGVIHDQSRFSELYDLSKHLVSSIKEELVRQYSEIPTLPILADSMRLRHSLEISEPPFPNCPDDNLFLCLQRLVSGQEISMPPRTNRDSTCRPYLWWIVYAWERVRKGESIHVIPYTDSTDLNAIANLVWGDPDSLLSLPEPTSDEIDCLKALNDSDIKKLLYEFFMTHPKLTSISKFNLAAERDKGHGSGELADFNVEFETTSGPLQVCIVIKSGREVGLTAPEKITLDNIHQILRPIYSFVRSSVVVLGLIIREATLNLIEFYTQMRNRREMPVILFDVSFFYRLLKRERLGPC